MRSKVALIERFIKEKPTDRGRDKHRCISKYLEEQLEYVSPEVVREILSLSRAWRKALELNPEIDYRGDTTDAENYMKKEMR